MFHITFLLRVTSIYFHTQFHLFVSCIDSFAAAIKQKAEYTLQAVIWRSKNNLTFNIFNDQRQQSQYPVLSSISTVQTPQLHG